MRVVVIEESVQGLRLALQRLCIAVDELLLFVSHDQPPNEDLAAADDVEQAALEIRGRLADARSAVEVGTAEPRSANAGVGLEAVAEVHRLVSESATLYWSKLRAYEAVARLRASFRRRGGDWPSWWLSVEQSLRCCEVPLRTTDEAINSVLRELAAETHHDQSTENITRRSS